MQQSSEVESDNLSVRTVSANISTARTSPCLVMGIEGGYFGKKKEGRIYAAVQLTPAMRGTFKSICDLSDAINGRLAFDYWPVSWDMEQQIDPDRQLDETRWQFHGRTFWAQLVTAKGRLLAESVQIDVRELEIFSNEKVIWQTSDYSESMVLKAYGRPFAELAWERLQHAGIVDSDEPVIANACTSKMRRELLDLLDDSIEPAADVRVNPFPSVRR